MLRDNQRCKWPYFPQDALLQQMSRLQSYCCNDLLTGSSSSSSRVQQGQEVVSMNYFCWVSQRSNNLGIFITCPLYRLAWTSQCIDWFRPIGHGFERMAPAGQSNVYLSLGSDSVVVQTWAPPPYSGGRDYAITVTVFLRQVATFWQVASALCEWPSTVSG